MKIFLVVEVQRFFFVLPPNAFMLELVLFSGFLPSCTHNLCSPFFPLFACFPPFQRCLLKEFLGHLMLLWYFFPASGLHEEGLWEDPGGADPTPDWERGSQGWSEGGAPSPGRAGCQLRPEIPGSGGQNKDQRAAGGWAGTEKCKSNLFFLQVLSLLPKHSQRASQKPAGVTLSSLS